ncbi:MAG: thiosulfate oxidation carrier complex protein SoxZ [Nevskiaceae bacterium]|nr:MAG: thiosulfate oxidation carrier complex protein SoxZ [Nevskiaceae bacterium]TBR71973.1 MAG: thiosulfate oxidation carrier complex protein SoxZ [Nevskiaceae bacterium]
MADDKEIWKPVGTIKARARVEADGSTLVKVLIRHPMDSGFEFTRDFVPIPPHYIETLTFWHRGRMVFHCNWGPAVSKDPFLSFKFDGAKAGDTLEARWHDNEKLSDSLKFTVE